jgi:hypothetical protein
MDNLSTVLGTKVRNRGKSRKDDQDAKKLKIWKDAIAVYVKLLSRSLYRDTEEEQSGLQMTRPYSNRAISEYYQPASFAAYTECPNNVLSL